MSTSTDRIANALYQSHASDLAASKSSQAQPALLHRHGPRLSAPKQLDILATEAAEQIRQIQKTESITKLASIELKGALIVPSIAVKLDIPCVIVRKEEKAYGVTGRIAGADVAKGDNVLFFDDVISEGLSKIEGIKPLTELGANVKHMLVVVNREHGGKEKLEQLGYKIHALAKITDVVNSLYANKHISKEEAARVLDYVQQFKN
jgi:uridine monophosphate synthetase